MDTFDEACAAWNRRDDDELTRLREALERIAQWAQAYPLTVFPKPDLARAALVLEQHGMTLDAISADAIRHVVEGVGRIATHALENDDGQS